MIFAKRNLPLFSSVDTEKSRDSKEQGRIFCYYYCLFVCFFLFPPMMVGLLWLLFSKFDLKCQMLNWTLLRHKLFVVWFFILLSLFFFFLKLCCCYYTHAHSLTYKNFYFCAFVLLPHNSLICRFIYRFFIVSVIHNFIDFFKRRYSLFVSSERKGCGINFVFLFKFLFNIFFLLWT